MATLADRQRFIDMLQTRGEIGVAIGITMLERGLNQDEARAHLIETSQVTNTKIREVVSDVARRATPPGR